MQFSRGGKNVVCEDYFDNMIVFSDAWWIGRKDENPEEARLEFPKELNVQQEKLECDFKGGAGATCVKNEVLARAGSSMWNNNLLNMNRRRIYQKVKMIQKKLSN